MHFLYKTLTWLAVAGAPFYATAALLRNPSALASVRQRLGFPEEELVRQAAGGVWIQAASVGELQVAHLVAGSLHRSHPGLKVNISVTTASARRLLHQSPPPAGAAFTFPLDLPPAVSRVVRVMRPRLLITVETELWPNLFAACRRQSVPVALVNGRISDRGMKRYRRVRRLMRRTLANVSLVCARSDVDAQRFIELGMPEHRVMVTGDLKMDGQQQQGHTIAAELTALLQGRHVLVAGSTHPGEEEAALNAGRKAAATGSPTTVVLAPRHLERLDDVVRHLQTAGLPWCRRSGAVGVSPPAGKLFVLLLDTHGELAGLYGAAQVAFLGGTLAAIGGHNPLEAAAAGIPQVCGPHRSNISQVAADLEEVGALLPAQDAEEVSELLSDLLVNAPRARELGRHAKDYVSRRSGNVETTMSALGHLLTHSGSRT